MIIVRWRGWWSAVAIEMLSSSMVKSIKYSIRNLIGENNRKRVNNCLCVFLSNFVGHRCVQQNHLQNFANCRTFMGILKLAYFSNA